MTGVSVGAEAAEQSQADDPDEKPECQDSDRKQEHDERLAPEHGLRKARDLFQRPHVIGHASLHRRARPPSLGSQLHQCPYRRIFSRMISALLRSAFRSGRIARSPHRWVSAVTL